MHQEPMVVGSEQALVSQLTAKMIDFKQRRLRVLDGTKKMLEMSVNGSYSAQHAHTSAH